MSEETSGQPSPDAIPEATVKTKRNFSIVWLIPLVAALIGAFLAYKAISERGPTITIYFKTANGLAVDKTKIRFKNVEVGKVTNIDVDPDLSRVIVTAEFRQGAEKYLTDKTLFWVERARVAAGEVSGLGTLFSGAYIGIDPGTEGKPARSFVGLERPPVIRADVPGADFSLRSNRLGSLERGSPVYYRQFKVGQVTDYELAEDGQTVGIQVFVHAPHHERVHENTVFWNASGLDVSLTAEGIRVDTESVVSMLLGGIAFDTPESLEPGRAPQEGHVFDLYANRQATEERAYTRKRYYLLYFQGSVRGLAVGAPVEVRGIRIGKVIDVKLQFDVGELEPRIPVLIETEPDRIQDVGGEDTGEDRIEELVAKGMRAQLKTGSLLTGQLYVDIDFYPDAETATVTYEGAYPVIPTLPSSMEEIRASLTGVLAKIEKLPIEAIGDQLRGTLEGTNRLTNSTELQEAVRNLNETLAKTTQLAQTINTQVAVEAGNTLRDAQVTLSNVNATLSPESSLYQDIQFLVQELSAAARSIRIMADYLERHPDALIKGKQ